MLDNEEAFNVSTARRIVSVIAVLLALSGGLFASEAFVSADERQGQALPTGVEPAVDVESFGADLSGIKGPASEATPSVDISEVLEPAGALAEPPEGQLLDQEATEPGPDQAPMIIAPGSCNGRQLTGSGRIDPANEQEFFGVELSAGRPTRIEAERTSGNLDGWLALFDPSGVEVAYDDDSGGNYNPRLTYTPRVSGRFRIRVSSFGWRSTGDYIVSVCIEGGGPPSAPTSVSAQGVSASEIRVSWSSVSGATSYRIEGHNCGVTTSSTSYVCGGYSGTSAFYFRVFARNSYGESVPSGWVSAAPLASACNPPANAVVLYEHLHAGRCWSFTGDHPNFTTIGANDTVSSIQFRGSYASGWEAELYEHSDYVGRSTIFRGDNWEFGREAIGNDTASSIRIRRSGSPVASCDYSRLDVTGQAGSGSLASRSAHNYCLSTEGSRWQGRWISVRANRTSGNMDTVVRLYSPSGALVAQNDDTAGLDRGSLMSAVLSQSGLYRLEVSGYGTTSGGYRTHVTLNRMAHVADANADCVVSSGDEWLVSHFLGSTGDPDKSWMNADINLDGMVNTLDLAVVLTAAGTRCP